MKNKNIAIVGVFSALYVAVTLALSPVSYGPIQIRLSGALYQLVKKNKVFIYAMVLGTIIANFFSPLGIIDVFLGTLTSLVGCLGSYYVCKLLKKKWQQEVATALIFSFACFFVALELNIVYNIPLLVNWLYVGIGEFIAVMLGAPLVRGLEKRISL